MSATISTILIMRELPACIHFGIPFGQTPPPTLDQAMTDNDSWEEWSEPREDGGAVHWIIYTTRPNEVIELLLADPDLLVPMKYPRQENIIASLTDPDNWENEYVHWKVAA